MPAPLPRSPPQVTATISLVPDVHDDKKKAAPPPNLRRPTRPPSTPAATTAALGGKVSSLTRSSSSVGRALRRGSVGGTFLSMASGQGTLSNMSTGKSAPPNPHGLHNEKEQSTISTFRVVVLAEDRSSSTYVLHFQVEPPPKVPAIPAAIQPLIHHLIKYYGHGTPPPGGSADSTGHLTFSCERFVACCVTLRIAHAAVARAAFVQVALVPETALQASKM